MLCPGFMYAVSVLCAGTKTTSGGKPLDYPRSTVLKLMIAPVNVRQSTQPVVLRWEYASLSSAVRHFKNASVLPSRGYHLTLVIRNALHMDMSCGVCCDGSLHESSWLSKEEPAGCDRLPHLKLPAVVSIDYLRRLLTWCCVRTCPW